VSRDPCYLIDKTWRKTESNLGVMKGGRKEENAVISIPGTTNSGHSPLGEGMIVK